MGVARTGVAGCDELLRLFLATHAYLFRGHCVSASVGELCRDVHDVTRAFYDDCYKRGIAVRHILYEVGDAALLTRVLDEKLLTAPDLQLIFVLGRYTVGQKSDPKELDPFLDWLTSTGRTPDWAVCAFGPRARPRPSARRSGGWKVPHRV